MAITISISESLYRELRRNGYNKEDLKEAISNYLKNLAKKGNDLRLGFTCIFCGKKVVGYKALKESGYFEDELPICKECRKS